MDPAHEGLVSTNKKKKKNTTHREAKKKDHGVEEKDVPESEIRPTGGSTLAEGES